MKKLYINIEDYQKTDWAIGRTMTALEWDEQAKSWSDMDETEYNEDYTFTIEDINEYWEINIVEYDENNKEHVNLKKEEEEYWKKL